MEKDISGVLKDADKRMFISAFQQIVLNSDYREEFLEKGSAGIRPKFGDTFVQKIFFNPRIVYRVLYCVHVLSFSSLYKAVIPNT